MVRARIGTRTIRRLRSAANGAIKPGTAHNGFAARCAEVAMPFRPKALSNIGAAPRIRGHSPEIKRPVNGGAQPPPHIGRQSRCERVLQRKQEVAALLHTGYAEQKRRRQKAEGRKQKAEGRRHLYDYRDSLLEVVGNRSYDLTLTGEFFRSEDGLLCSLQGSRS